MEVEAEVAVEVEVEVEIEVEVDLRVKVGVEADVEVDVKFEVEAEVEVDARFEALVGRSAATLDDLQKAWDPPAPKPRGADWVQSPLGQVYTQTHCDTLPSQYIMLVCELSHPVYCLLTPESHPSPMLTASAAEAITKTIVAIDLKMHISNQRGSRRKLMLRIASGRLLAF